jgi:AcrR family transcriptional regulator
LARLAARTGPKGLDPGAILDAAVALLEQEGEAGFSVRKLAARFGCDPMAVLYHFGNKDGLERAIGEWLAAKIALKDPGAPWDERLMALALQYRDLACRYPKSFPLLLRFWTTGPADLRLAEQGYAAFAEAGHSDPDIVDLCLGWYASILGLAAAEAGGLLRAASPEAIAALAEIDPAQFPLTARLRPSLAQQHDRDVFAGFAALLVKGVAKERPGSR